MQGDFRVGDTLVQPRINSIQNDGDPVHVEPKVMQVLLVLAADPGEVVTREAIRSVVWPDVFVGDDVLMRAISELRRAFRDDARTPRTIQTIPKVGYRLIAAVEQGGVPEVRRQEVAVEVTIPGASAAPSSVPAEPTFSPPELPAAMPWVALPAPVRSRRALLSILVSATSILVALLATWLLIARHASAPASVASYFSHPLTTYPGSQLEPAISPDGSAVAFVWRHAPGQNGHIYIKAMNSGSPVQLTSGPDEEFSPSWSPDGRSIAFIRHSPTQSTVNMVPAFGGSEQVLYTLPVNAVWEYGGTAWSPDGLSLIFPQQAAIDGASSLVELSLTTRTVRAITTPPAGADGDWMPAVSPDGTMIAFTRGAERSTRDVFVLKRSNGVTRRLTSDSRMVLGLTWTTDSRSVVFSSNRGGSLSLWRIFLNGGLAEREPVGTEDAYWPMISKSGNLLTYSHGTAAWITASIQLGAGKPDGETAVLTSSEQDTAPQVAPSGDRIAFQSWRSGSQEIWTAGLDGSNPVQMTDQGASAGSPAWSRDGRRLAFDARPQGLSHIFVMDANGGAPYALTSGQWNEIVPSWSADGRWIYFGSNRSGVWQIWRLRSDGQGPAQQVTEHGGMVGREGADGRWLYFSRFDTLGLWRRPVAADGVEQKIFDGPPAGYQNYWTVAGVSIYALAARNKEYDLVRIDLGSGHVNAIYTMKHGPIPFAGLTVTPDEKQLLFAQLASAESNITLVEHFR